MGDADDMKTAFGYDTQMSQPAMSDEAKPNYSAMSAFIVGYTGEVGKELVKELVGRKVFRKVVLIGRRPAQLSLNDEVHQKGVLRSCEGAKQVIGGERSSVVEHKVVDFDQLDKHAEAFKECTVGFCCLGTTVSKAGAQGFVKVDHDYVVEVAKLAHTHGCQHFSVVSSSGANKNSCFLYMKTKALMEDHVAEIGFPRFTVFRPKFLLCDRVENRIGERLALFMMKPVVWACPTLLSVPTNTVAKAMVADLWRKTSNKVDVIENAAIHQLAQGV